MPKQNWSQLYRNLWRCETAISQKILRVAWPFLKKNKQKYHGFSLLSLFFKLGHYGDLDNNWNWYFYLKVSNKDIAFLLELAVHHRCLLLWKKITLIWSVYFSTYLYWHLADVKFNESWVARLEYKLTWIRVIRLTPFGGGWVAVGNSPRVLCTFKQSLIFSHKQETPNPAW